MDVSENQVDIHKWTVHFLQDILDSTNDHNHDEWTDHRVLKYIHDENISLSYFSNISSNNSLVFQENAIVMSKKIMVEKVTREISNYIFVSCSHERSIKEKKVSRTPFSNFHLPYYWFKLPKKPAFFYDSIKVKWKTYRSKMYACIWHA